MKNKLKLSRTQNATAEDPQESRVKNPMAIFLRMKRAEQDRPNPETDQRKDRANPETDQCKYRPNPETDQRKTLLNISESNSVQSVCRNRKKSPPSQKPGRRKDQGSELFREYLQRKNELIDKEETRHYNIIRYLKSSETAPRDSGLNSSLRSDNGCPVAAADEMVVQHAGTAQRHRAADMPKRRRRLPSDDSGVTSASQLQSRPHAAVVTSSVHSVNVSSAVSSLSSLADDNAQAWRSNDDGGSTRSSAATGASARKRRQQTTLNASMNASTCLGPDKCTRTFCFNPNCLR